jgi:hypothetical protein
MPYKRCSPSSKNNIGSNRHWVALQRDGLYTGAECEGRAHLKYKIRTFWIYKSVRFEEMFVNLWFLMGFGYSIYNFCCNTWFKKRRYSACFTFIEQEIDILNLNRCLHLLFIMGGKFFLMIWPCCFVVCRTGGVSSQKILLNSKSM